MSQPPCGNRKREPADFSRSYTIPKKQFKGDYHEQNDAECQQSELLNNSYDDNRPNLQRFQPRGLPKPLPHSNFCNNSMGYPMVNFNNFGNFLAPRFPNQDNLNPKQPSHGNQLFQYNAPNAQNHYREVPKTGNVSATKYQDTFPHNSDPTLPKELTEQFQPLYCKLCAAQLSSNVMAKLHYKSKNHEKKVRKFLTDYSERTGEPLHERAKIVGCKKQKPEEDNDPKYFHCNVCDLPLTGKLHAESHYMGKNHQRALAGKTPAGRGHYDNEGNWVRTTPTILTERDSFGLDFVKTDEAPTSSIPDSGKTKSLQCELCGVSVTSEQQMTMHISGQRHKKKVEQQAKEKEEENKIAQPDDSILSSLTCTNISSADLSVYRTPTGYYYCNPCNLSLNSETQFKQHLESKKHRKKASTNKEQTT